jgi:hypothetical protein
LTKVLFIVNKYVSGQGNQKFYPYFLKYLQDNINEKDFDLRYVFFSDLFKESVITKNDYWYNESDLKKLDNQTLEAKARQIEGDYKFTFKQAYFPEIFQSSDFTNKKNLREINLPEYLFTDLNHLVARFEFVEKLIIDKGIDIVFSCQSTDAEIEFSREICLKHNKVFLRILPSYFSRRTIHQQFEFGKEKIIEAIYDNNNSTNIAEKFLDDYIANKRPPYKSPSIVSINNSFANNIYNKIKQKSPRLLPFLLFKSIVKRINDLIFKLFIIFESFLKKIIIEKNYNPSKPNLFLGFHLTTEADFCLRGLPYIDQTFIVKSLSHVLPYGTTLYIREHPHWKETFKFKQLYKISKFPNVRIISTDISIHKILKNCNGVLTYNATTGIEALIYGKPVLSFSPNIYFDHHPAVDCCYDLYQLGEKLTKLVNTKVNREDTIKYLRKMFRISNDIPMESETFLSEEDAKEKSGKLASHLMKAFDICLDENVTSNR